MPSSYGTIPPTAGLPARAGTAKREATAQGMVLYAAAVLLATVAAVAVVVSLGADGGHLQQIVRLQAPSGKRGVRAMHAQGLTPARGRVPPQQHLRLKAMADRGMSQAMGATMLDDEEEECICDDHFRCYACFEHHAEGGEHHEEHHEEKSVRAQKLAQSAAEGLPFPVGHISHVSLDEEEEHGEHDEHAGHHSGYEHGHQWHTKIKFFKILPDCCEHPSLQVEEDFDRSFNKPCTMDEAALEPFAAFGHAKVCDEHDMMDAQTTTHNLNVWIVMLTTILWMFALIWGAEKLKHCGGVHDHGHKEGHSHDEHDTDNAEAAHDDKNH